MGLCGLYRVLVGLEYVWSIYGGYVGFLLGLESV